MWHRGRAEFPERHPGLVTVRVRKDVPSLRTQRLVREVRAALAYVLLNARKHAAKRLASAMATAAALDPASSARWFEGWADAPAPIGAPGVAFRVGPPADLHSNHCSDPPAIAPAQTWLLRLGWRRYGLIRPTEVPGSKRSVGRSRI